MDIYDDNYCSDEEWNDAVRDPDKVIVLEKNTFGGVSNTRIEERNQISNYERDIPNIELIMIHTYEKLQAYARNNSIEICNHLSFYDFQLFLKNYIKENYSNYLNF